MIVFVERAFPGSPTAGFPVRAVLVPRIVADRPETRIVRVDGSHRPVDLPIVAGAVRRGEILLSVGGVPAAIRTARGTGEVVFFAIPIDQADLEGAVGAEALWTCVVEAPPPREEEKDLRRRKKKEDEPETHFESLNGFWNAQEPGTPLAGVSFAVGAAIVAMYAMFIGPLDYFWRRRRERLARGWVSFAGATAASVAALLFWGGAVYPPRSQAVEVVLADEGLIRTLAVVRAGGSGERRVTPGGACLISKWAAEFGDGGNPPAWIEDESLAVPLRGLSSVSLAAVRSVKEGDVEVDCSLEPNGRLQVRNGSRVRLKECLIVSRDSIHRLGEIPAGERREWSLQEIPSESFKGWAAALLGGSEDSLWWTGWNDLLYRVPREKHPLALTLCERIQRDRHRDHDRRRLEHRGLDLTHCLDRGDSLFLGSFEEDAGAIRISPEPQVTVRGLVRRVVRSRSE